MALIPLLLLLAVWSSTASPAVTFGGHTHDRLLKSVSATTAADTMTLELELAQPVQYAWHFPKTPSREVLIAVRMTEPPRDATGRPEYREHLAAPKRVRDVVEDIGFESSDMHGNFIVLHFVSEASVAVSPGDSAYQLRITIHRNGAPASTGCSDGHSSQDKN